MDGPSNTTVFAYDASGKLVAEYLTEQASSPTVNYTATDPLGSPRVITNKQGEVVSRRDFMPFGEEIAPDAAYRTAALKYGISDGVRQKFTGYQRDEETDLDFAEARYYYNDHGRFTAVDPLLASGKSANPQSFNRYIYVLNNPLRLVDPTGKSPSTHIDENGKVVAVIDDGDLGVYQHKNNADGKAPTEYMIKRRQKKSGSTAAGGTKVGKTVIWHEFREHDKAGNPTSEIAKGAQIVSGLDFSPVVNKINDAAKELTLGQVMDMSKHGEGFDIKNNTTLAPYGPNTGGLLGGNFVTARSAGNFLAGMNGANVSTNSYVNDYVSLDAYMRIAGEYEQTGEMDAATAVNLRTGAISPTVNSAPYYGESSYSGMWIMAGYEYGKSRR
ncbi:MAG: RHS repeat-associated core domain-containing protein [Acidobacteria bacterium]|nr:RHS repeat-associated core domain-containing protein [Acidobacteriota bacterium]